MADPGDLGQVSQGRQRLHGTTPHYTGLFNIVQLDLTTLQHTYRSIADASHPAVEQGPLPQDGRHIP